MSQLETYSNNIIIKGKPKIYLCFDEEDYELHFEHNAELLLDAAPSAVIFYRKKQRAEKPDDECCMELEEMNLFVVLVTENVISGKSKILPELAFAREKGIPILPLMQDGIDASRFEDIMPSMHCLDEYKTDMSAIPFTHKLKSYLDSVLISEQLANEIRSAFDAYIFVSYRKKDRDYAKKIMELIHQDDFSMNIATWYDEFLVPGEDYNEAILDAIKKSKLFTLVVTPNILEEGNYVIKHEYPDAKEFKIKRVGIEMVPTNKDELKDKFEELDDIILADDKEGLRQAILQAVKHTALEDKSDDGKHLFFMGLAYLTGIDVIRDVEKGIKLIERASELGIHEAYEKLVDIYYSGEYLKLEYNASFSQRLYKKDNIAKASKWQNKYAFILEKELKSGITEEKLIKYINERAKQSQLCLEFVRLPENRITYYTDEAHKDAINNNHEEMIKSWVVASEKCIASIIQYCEEYSNEYDLSCLFLKTMAEYHINKDLYATEDDDKVLHTLVDEYEKIIQASSKFDLEYSLVYASLANAYGSRIISRAFGRTKEAIIEAYSNAIIYYRKAKETYVKCLKQDDRVEIMRANVCALNDYAAGIKILNLDEDFEGIVKEAILLGEKLVSKTKAMNDQRELAKCYGHILELEKIVNSERIDYLKKQIALLEEVKKKSYDLMVQITLASAKKELEELGGQ